MNTKYEAPDGLLEHGRRAWDVYVESRGDSMTTVDTLLLEQFCRLTDALPGLTAKVTEGANGAMVSWGIAIDKLLMFSAKLGLSQGDRVKLKLELSPAEKEKLKPKERPKVTRVRKSSLDDFTPEQLGIVPPRTTLDELRALKPAQRMGAAAEEK